MFHTSSWSGTFGGGSVAGLGRSELEPGWFLGGSVGVASRNMGLEAGQDETASSLWPLRLG